MAIENQKSADNNNVDEIGRLVQDLTSVVEQEVKAFQSLLDALLEQQASILRGDSLSVTRSNEEVDAIVAETKILERTRQGKSLDISRMLNADEEMTLSEMLPFVEQRYANRLSELKQVLLTLSRKIESTNQRNQYLLEHSLRFVDNCLRVLVNGREGEIAYNPSGKVAVQETSLYSGVG